MAVGPSHVAFRDSPHVGTHTCRLMTGLMPFTLTHGGPSPPGVRFAAGVTDDDASLGTRCLAKASGAGAFPRLTKPNFARRTRNGEILGARVMPYVASMATISLTPVGHGADVPQPLLRPSPATGHEAEISDVDDPGVGYDTENFHIPSDLVVEGL
jgi:hypothetical protein